MFLWDVEIWVVAYREKETNSEQKKCFLKIFSVSQNSTGKILREKSSLWISLLGYLREQVLSYFSTPCMKADKSEKKQTTKKSHFCIFSLPATQKSSLWERKKYFLYSKIKVNKKYFDFRNRYFFVNLFVFLCAPEAVLSSPEIK